MSLLMNIIISQQTTIFEYIGFFNTGSLLRTHTTTVVFSSADID